MTTALRGGLVLLLLAAGCTLADRRGDLEILPGGPLRASAKLTFEIRARSSAPQAIVSIDGRDRGPYDTNKRLDLDVAGLAEGVHTIRARLATGGKDSPERTFEIDRTAPTVTVDPRPGIVTTADPFVVTLSFSKPIDAALLRSTLALKSVTQALSVVATEALPTTVNVAADGRSATVRLDVSLRFVESVQLELPAFDPFGNAMVLPPLPIAWSAPPSPFDVPMGLVADQSVAIPVSLAPGWAGAAGPLTVLLCPGAPSLSGPSGCLEATLASAPGVVTFDTSALPDGFCEVLVRSPTFRQSPARLLTIHHPSFWVDLGAERSPVNGPVGIWVRIIGDIPPSLDVLVNGAVIGTVVQTPGVGQITSTLTWSAAVPDGTYALGVAAPAGWTVQPRQVGSVTVDRTPPTFELREPTVLEGPLPWAHITASEDVMGQATLLLDGVPVAGGMPYGARDFYLSGVPTGPSTTDGTLTFDVSGVMDAAHNVGSMAASIRYPVWFAPFGEGPLQVAGAPIVAKEAVATRFEGTTGRRVAWIDGSHAVHWSDGAVDSVISGTGASATGLIVPIGRDDTYPSIESAAWSEVAGGGSTSVQFWRPSRPVTTATSPGASLPRIGPETGPVYAWTEPEAAGRAAKFMIPDQAALPPFAPAGGLPTDAVTDCCFMRGAAGSHRALAWIDGGGAVPQMALAGVPVSPVYTATGPWLTVATSLNVDPTKPASEAAISVSTLAWLEGGVVRSARIDAAGTGVVHDDPPSTGPCRWLRFLPASATPVLVFVETGAAGDVIAARRWIAGTGWTSLPAVNAGVAGPVRSLAVAGSVVTWTDDLGHVYARRLNR